MADGAHIQTSPELYLDAQIRKYGVWAVMGRPLAYEEIVAMDAALEIVGIYKEMTNSNYATWTKENPEKANLLFHVMELLNG